MYIVELLYFNIHYIVYKHNIISIARYLLYTGSVIVLIGKTWLSRFAIFRKVLSQNFFFFLFRCCVSHCSRQFKYKTFYKSYKANIYWKTFSLRCAEAAISSSQYLFIVFSQLYIYLQFYIIPNKLFQGG